MADTNPTPTPTPTPEPKKTRGKHGAINQEWLNEFTRAEAVAAAAGVEARVTKLSDAEIPATKVTALLADVDAARKLAGKAVQGASGKHILSEEEETRKQALLKEISNIQTRARQKYDAAQPARLKEYGIGQRYANSRSLLEQMATNILLKLNGDDKTPADKLPGVTAAKIGALQTALDDYQSAQGDQSGAQGAATTWRKQVEKAVADIVKQRREIQFAAAAEWPHTNPANAGVRKEFLLPPNRAMK